MSKKLKLTIEQIYELKTTKRSSGYIYCVYNNKSVQRSHLVAREILGWTWNTKTHIIHHINKNKSDDLPDNLMLVTRGGHNTIHLTGNQYNKGRVYTEEQRQKMSAAIKGKMSVEKRKELSERMKGQKYTLGYKHTNEAIERIRKAAIGRKHSEEVKQKLRKPKSDVTKLKISEGRKGIIFSEKHLKNLSEAHKGKKVSEETKLKMSLAKKGKLKGPMSEEQKLKISETLKNRNRR
jgi:hypothetical protein